MDTAFWTRAGAAVMMLAVALGAFGAHGLKSILSDEMKTVFETGVRYQAYHGIGLFVVAALAARFPSKYTATAGVCFLGGTLLFSGSLYALSLTGLRKFGAVTPLGGLLLILGWALLLAAPYKI